MRLVSIFPILLCLQPAAATGPNSALRVVEPGQWVKLEARLQSDGRLSVRELQPAPPDAGFEIEGPIRDLDTRKGTFTVGPWRFRITQKTKFENAERQPRAVTDLAKKRRVKVKARAAESKYLTARTVRIYENSTDADYELVAPVDTVDVKRMELSVASNRMRVSDRTRYLNFTSAALLPEELEPNRRIRRDDDDQSPDPIRIGRLYIGGKAGATYEHTRDLDLDRNHPDRQHWVMPNAQVEIAAPLGEFSEAYAKLELNRPMAAGPGQPGGRADFNVREAFLYVGNVLHPSIGLQVGRQRFRDKREWLYDDELDAVRLHFIRSKFTAEVAVAKGLFGPTGSRSDQYYFIARSEYRLPGRKYLSAYIIKRNDLTARDEDPIWFGLSSRGRIVRNLEYWTELARMKGRRGVNLLRGYGYDAGASYRLPLPWQPTLSAGYAFGSGDANLSDGVDGNFRQTGLQDNSYRTGGLRRYRYYGVVLDPELYNLRTVLFNANVRPLNPLSIDVNLHTYRQAVAAKKPGDMELTLRPSGRDPRFGKEVDLIVLIRAIRNVDIGFSAGVFLPGPAFRGAPARAYGMWPELRCYF